MLKIGMMALLIICSITTPENIMYMEIQDDVLTGTIHIRVHNLNEKPYFINWTNAPVDDFYRFFYQPDYTTNDSSYQDLTIKISNPDRLKVFTFTLFDDTNGHLIDSETIFWEAKTNTEIKIPEIPVELFIMAIPIGIGWLIFNYLIRRGR